MLSLNIPLRVRNLVEKYDTSDPYRLAKELNCVVLFADLPMTVNGFWKRILRRKLIMINENLTEWQQAAVLCHELGHVICHPGYAAFSMHIVSFSSSRIEDISAQMVLENFSFSFGKTARIFHIKKEGVLPSFLV